MQFFVTGVDVLQKLVVLIGAGLGLWGIVNLLEGYGNDNPGSKSQGMKQFMSGAGIILIAMLLIPQLKTLFNFNLKWTPSSRQLFYKFKVH
jgi:Maff2 family